MTTTATPEPGKKINRIGLEMAPYRGGKTTLCAGCGHNAISERIIDAFFEMGIDPQRRHQAVGHRLLEQEPGVFPRLRPRLQHRARPDAVGRHRRGARQPQAACDRRQRRRRHRRDRHRPVRAPDAPQRAADLHHRRQRLLRPDQGAVLADRRHRLDHQGRHAQRAAADRHLLAGDRSRRLVRGAVVLRGQEAAADDPQGGAQPPRHLHDRRAVAVRDLQRSPGLDQELRLRQGARRGARRDQLRSVLRRHHDRLRAGHDDRGEAARRFEAVPEEGERGLQPDRQARGAAAAAGDRQARRVRHRHPLRRARTSRTWSTCCNIVDEPLATLPTRRASARRGQPSTSSWKRTDRQRTSEEPAKVASELLLRLLPSPSFPPLRSSRFAPILSCAVPIGSFGRPSLSTPDPLGLPWLGVSEGVSPSTAPRCSSSW